MNLLAYFCHIPKPLLLGPASSLASSTSSNLHPETQRLQGWPWVWVVPGDTKTVCPYSGQQSGSGFGFPQTPSRSTDTPEYLGRGSGRLWGLSGCSCWRKLPVEFGGCGELKPRVSNVNKEASVTKRARYSDWGWPCSRRLRGETAAAGSVAAKAFQGSRPILSFRQDPVSRVS